MGSTHNTHQIYFKFKVAQRLGWWCGRWESNPHDVTHKHLKLARLPFRHFRIFFQFSSFNLNFAQVSKTCTPLPHKFAICVDPSHHLHPSNNIAREPAPPLPHIFTKLKNNFSKLNLSLSLSTIFLKI